MNLKYKIKVKMCQTFKEYTYFLFHRRWLNSWQLLSQLTALVRHLGWQTEAPNEYKSTIDQQ